MNIDGNLEVMKMPSNVSFLLSVCPRTLSVGLVTAGTDKVHIVRSVPLPFSLFPFFFSPFLSLPPSPSPALSTSPFPGRSSRTCPSKAEEIPSRLHTANMAPSSVLGLFILALLSLRLDPIHSETVADAAPTPHKDSQDTSSGGDAFDVTTKDPFHDLTDNAFTFEYEDNTRFQPLDEDNEVLGPGAITAIVIAVFLGASVLLALIVIMLRKFSSA
ncbi:hypothetical protein ANANG_G00127070 [Anguilla anguilla]|uniref:Secondary ossification center associated regulator of chondrocyte maturation n=1 Tax=Anguilla anguilla TaxID=7936 RepID=A0A9D3MEJ5_ANGAN|nr:hypothetical protein ANANG_G00127070 [Anguilla anguilla]